MSNTKTAPKRAPKVGANSFSINLADENSDSLPTSLGIKPQRAKEITDHVQDLGKKGDLKVSSVLHQLGEDYPNPNERAYAVYSMGNIHAMSQGGEDLLSRLLGGSDKGADMPGWGDDGAN